MLLEELFLYGDFLQYLNDVLGCLYCVEIIELGVNEMYWATLVSSHRDLWVPNQIARRTPIAHVKVFLLQHE